MSNLKIKFLILIIVFLSSLLPFKSLWGCDSLIYKVAKRDWSRDRYKLYLFYESNSPESETLLSLLKQKKAEWWPKANLRIFTIDMLKIEHKYKKIVEQYPPMKIPEIIILSPDTALVTRIHNPINSQLLDEIISSHKRREIVQRLDEKGALFLCFLNKKDKKSAKEILKTVKNVAKRSEMIFNQVIPVVELYSNDPREEILVHNIATLGNSNQSTAFLVFGKGKMISNKPDQAIQERLIDQVQMINHPCACTINPVEFGTDLLLTWE